MKKILVTGGTVFVSRYIAEYFAKLGHDVHVLNRNTRPQSEGVTLIEADRHQLGDQLKAYHFDVVMDVTAYTAQDITDLLDALGGFEDYIFISSSAVYPETGKQPFTEKISVGENKYWGSYGTNKIEAEKSLLERVPSAYVLRPPYLYGPMNDVYREGFVFDCAMANRKFYLPEDGQMQLQFYYIEDLCRFVDVLLEKKPKQHIFNVGNKETISIREWVTLCYQVAGRESEFIEVHDGKGWRNYFPFANYEYSLDVSAQVDMLPDTISIEEGLKEAFVWYKDNADQVEKRPYFEYIDLNL